MTNRYANYLTFKGIYVEETGIYYLCDFYLDEVVGERYLIRVIAAVGGNSYSFQLSWNIQDSHSEVFGTAPVGLAKAAIERILPELQFRCGQDQ